MVTAKNASKHPHMPRGQSPSVRTTESRDLQGGQAEGRKSRQPVRSALRSSKGTRWASEGWHICHGHTHSHLSTALSSPDGAPARARREGHSAHSRGDVGLAQGHPREQDIGTEAGREHEALVRQGLGCSGEGPGWPEPPAPCPAVRVWWNVQRQCPRLAERWHEARAWPSDSCFLESERWAEEPRGTEGLDSLCLTGMGQRPSVPPGPPLCSLSRPSLSLCSPSLCICSSHQSGLLLRAVPGKIEPVPRRGPGAGRLPTRRPRPAVPGGCVPHPAAVKHPSKTWPGSFLSIPTLPGSDWLVLS